MTKILLSHIDIIHYHLDNAHIWHYIHSYWFDNDLKLHCILVHVISYMHLDALKVLSENLYPEIITSNIDYEGNCFIKIYYK